MAQRFWKNKTAVGTVFFVVLIALLGILAPWIAPNDPYAADILHKYESMSAQFPLGTDHLGRCLLSRLLYGIRPTFIQPG